MSVTSFGHIINPLLTKLVRSRWLCFYGPRLHLSPKQHTKKELGEYTAIWTSHLVSNTFIFLSRIVITVQPPAPLSALEDVPSSDNSPLSSLDAYPVMKAEPSPFSSRPVMFETEEVSADNSLCGFLCL